VGGLTVPPVHTDMLAGRGKTWRWMPSAAEALGDRVLASKKLISTLFMYTTFTYVYF